jgi:hypothetical protein
MSEQASNIFMREDLKNDQKKAEILALLSRSDPDIFTKLYSQ